VILLCAECFATIKLLSPFAILLSETIRLRPQRNYCSCSNKAKYFNAITNQQANEQVTKITYERAVKEAS